MSRFLMTLLHRTLPGPQRGLAIGWAAAILLTQALAGTPETLGGARPSLTALFVVLLVAAVASERPTENPAQRRYAWSLILTVSFLASPLVAMVVAGSVSFSMALARRRSTTDSLLASAAMVIAVSLGAMAGNQIAPLVDPMPNGTVSSAWLVAVAVASTTAYVVALLINCIIEAEKRGVWFTALLVDTVRINGPIDALLVFMAPLFIVVGISAPLLIPLLVVVLLAVRHSALAADSERHSATHDHITDMPNRSLFEHHAQRLLDTAAREDSMAALITIGLDGIAGIADRLGLDIRDAVLREVATRLADEARAMDLVVRLDGETFSVLLGRIENSRDGSTFARRVIDAIEHRMEIGGVPIGIGAHAGVSLFPANGEDIQQLTAIAAAARLDAMSSSDAVATASAPSARLGPAAGRHALLADLQRALDEDELVLYFQPKLHTISDDITGMEALIRWNHPTEGVVDPDRFMPQAEHTDLINDLTDRVIEMALDQLASWHEEGLMIGMAVNASARNLHDLHFPDRVRSALLRHDIDPSYLEIEITENAVLEDPTRSASVLGHLRGLGMSLTIDDFGTGYSSLASLRRLTIDRIKIDRSFVTELATNGDDLNIVRSVVDLGRNLGLSTVAEGVETPEVLDIVRSLGCDEYQGYLVSEPLPAAAMTELMRLRNAPRMALHIVR